MRKENTYHEEVVTSVHRRYETQRSHQSSSSIRNDITVQVGRNHNVEHLRLTEKTVDHGIDELLVELDTLVSTGTAVGLLILLVHAADGGTEETVGDREHVGFVADGDGGSVGGLRGLAEFLASDCDFKGLFADAGGSFFGDLSDGSGYLAVRTGFNRLGLDVLLTQGTRRV